VIQNLSAANAGSYSCLVSNSSGSTLSSPAVLTVTTTSNPGRLINESVLADIQGMLTVGFVIGGPGTSGSENLLIRATGPALMAFGVGGVMPDPTLTVIQQSGTVTVATDASWGSNQAAVTAADNATGAFALTNPASLDSALVHLFPSVEGGYTVQVKGKSGDSGNALAEVYDDTANYTLATPRLINISCLDQMTTGGMLTAGFVVGGSTSETVLVRASGPALVPFGVTGVMPDPQLTLNSTSGATPVVVATNAGWGGDTQITTAANLVGAFSWGNSATPDSAILLTLPPGAYTAQVSSVSGAGGNVLVEVYEVP
jgi:hypothetical protein